jgi:NAD+ synthase
MSQFSAATLVLDAEAEVDRIITEMRRLLRVDLKRRGLVLGLSGGIDSSVCAALAVRAVGPERVFGLYMPENDSDPESLALGQSVTETFGFAATIEDIGPSLTAMGCYERRDAFIRQLVPDYGPGWVCKVVIANPLEGQGLAVSSLVVQPPGSEQQKIRLTAEVYQGIIAATNMKQRTRKQLEYYHADRFNFAVIGTPNRLEYDQGFFVKNGDGAADLKPIAHLYKSQVYQLAAHLGVPETICRRPPTTDTWSMAQSQEEFYFSLPYDRMDLCLYGLNHGVPAAEVAAAAGLTEAQLKAVWADIERKRVATRYLHLPPLLIA